MNSDLMIHAMAYGGMVRCVAAVTTNLVNEAVQRHNTSPTASAALGRALTAGLLLSTMLKDVERLTLIFDCTGPIKRITVDADAHGRVRGYVQNPSIDLPLNGNSKFDVGGIVGGGMLYVIREGGFYEMGVYKDAYRGSVPIVSGEIAEDIAYYLTQSEQIPSAVSLGVRLVPTKPAGFVVESAGGFLVQILPGADNDIAASLEETIRALPAITTLIRQGSGPRQIIRDALGQAQFTILEERPVRFACSCSYERAVKIISAIDPNELQSMLMEDGGAEMVCHYCNTAYQIPKETLAEILARENRAMVEIRQE
ncbi:MAG: Hsp33 family molecular chaperone HslO [Acidobacteriota bacterium]|nr:Hsp33 family molecular chaperone HslO [Blastocatellia bacterium]MDW8238171.1 Hsp33 family molecular chaperone HslO [Acidobacteriota bacterium]